MRKYLFIIPLTMVALVMCAIALSDSSNLPAGTKVAQSQGGYKETGHQNIVVNTSGDIILFSLGIPTDDDINISFSTDDGATWIESQSITEGQDALPDIVINSTGQMIMMFTRDYLRGVYTSWSSESGTDWSTPILFFPSNTTDSVRDISLTIDQNDVIHYCMTSYEYKNSSANEFLFYGNSSSINLFATGTSFNDMKLIADTTTDNIQYCDIAVDSDEIFIAGTGDDQDDIDGFLSSHSSWNNDTERISIDSGSNPHTDLSVIASSDLFFISYNDETTKKIKFAVRNATNSAVFNITNLTDEGLFSMSSLVLDSDNTTVHIVFMESTTSNSSVYYVSTSDYVTAQTPIGLYSVNESLDYIQMSIAGSQLYPALNRMGNKLHFNYYDSDQKYAMYGSKIISQNPAVESLSELPDPVELDATIFLNATVTDNLDSLDTVIIQVNFTNTTLTNYSTSNVGNNYYNSSVPTSSIGTFKVSWFANDSSNNINATENSTFTVQDVTVPSVVGATPTSITQGNVLNVTVTVTDNVVVDSLVFMAEYYNGSLTNYSASKSGSSTYSNGSFATDHVATLNITMYANDSSNNVNKTEILNVEITSASTPPGGGGGGGDISSFSVVPLKVGESCESNDDCSTGICDLNATKTCVLTTCGNGVYEVTDGNTCFIDRSPTGERLADVFGSKKAANIFIFGLIILAGVGFLFLAGIPQQVAKKIKIRRRK